MGEVIKKKKKKSIPYFIMIISFSFLFIPNNQILLQTEPFLSNPVN